MAKPVVWFSFTLFTGDGDTASVEVDLPDVFQLFADGTEFQAVVPQRLYGQEILSAKVTVDCGDEGGSQLAAPGESVVALELAPFGPCESVRVRCRHSELAACQAALPEVGKLAVRAFEWAQRKAAEV